MKWSIDKEEDTRTSMEAQMLELLHLKLKTTIINRRIDMEMLHTKVSINRNTTNKWVVD